MRRSLLSVALMAAIGMLLLVLWRNAGSDVDSLEDIMHRHGLTAAEIAYGHSGEQPRVRTVNAKVDMVRPLYSLAKPITAAAALRVLDLDQKIEGATVRQLLQHSGGWDRAVAGDPVTRLMIGNDCTMLAVPEKQFRPGARYAYSNLGYCLVGRAIAEKTGKSFRESVADLFPETAAMDYDPALGPSGGWSGTARQYYSFASRPLPPETETAPLSRPNDLAYGLGWAIGPDFATHYGALRSNFSIVIKQGDYVAVGVFDGRPENDVAAAREIRNVMLRWKNGK